MQRAEHFAVNELIDCVKKEFLRQLNLFRLRTKLRPDTDEFLYVALQSEIRNLFIQLSGSLSALVNIAQNESVSAPFMVGAAVHKVECDIQRVDIRVVRVVDQRASVLPFFHFQAHCYGF